ncbi:MAG TPA: DUF6531 domain-containing protein, partial [Burkholderiaceae bacterium]|nr:DUF6531 domain-containing protein [Burkholderiaceae bacterium]
MSRRALPNPLPMSLALPCLLVALTGPPLPVTAASCGASGGGPSPLDAAQTDVCLPADEPASHPSAQPPAFAGNPVDLVTGNKYLRELDADWPSAERVSDALWLVFARHYNSAHAFERSLGPGWSHSYD